MEWGGERKLNGFAWPVFVVFLHFFLPNMQMVIEIILHAHKKQF